MVAESLFTALALCLDAFAIGLSYGIKDIKFPKTVLFIISFVSVSILALSMLAGTVFECFISNNLAALLSFLILLGLGCSFLIEGYVKHLIMKKRKMNDDKLAHFKIPSLGIVVNILVDNVDTKVKELKDITYKEAICLGIALSMDSLGIGFGSAVGNVNYMQVICFAFIFTFLSIPLGIAVGKRFELYSENIRTLWISGAILIVLGISKLT